MADFTQVAALVPTLCNQVGACASVAYAQTAVGAMADAEIIAVLGEADEILQQAEQLRLMAAGAIAIRSRREAGHSGAAQKRGHRNAVSLVQQLTGSTRAEASRQVRVGMAMFADQDTADDRQPDATEDPGAADDAGATEDPDATDEPGVADEEAEQSDAAEEPTGQPEAPWRPIDWRAPLRDARRDGRISTAQFDVIERGLGEPPAVSDDLDEPRRREADDAIRAAWAQAAEQLIAEAPERTTEELGAAARAIRDLLDPEGAERRFLDRHEKRSYREWTDQYGVRRASIAYDDHGASLLSTLFNAALRPRRGGPRFVDSEEKAAAKSLADDARTNEQLQYDLLLDLIRAGALAEAKDVFGTRQAGVRVVQVVDAQGEKTAYTEDGLVALPGNAVDQHICDTGAVPVRVDSCGNPLDVGREQRLFTPKQRIALAIRDGGCRWRGCDRPASYCEAHHIDEWQRDRGRTDIDRGILLCRFHHMELHHGGWRVTREGRGDFVLLDSTGGRHPLRPRGFLGYAWESIDPPPKRFRAAVA